MSAPRFDVPLRLYPYRQPYAWGSRTQLQEWLGMEPGEPLAELWFGAHPAGCAAVEVEGAGGADGETQSLRALIDSHAREVLGDRVLDRFGPRLPFLVKLLAVAEPLSLQLHPGAEAACRGFEREEAAGVPAAERRFVDRSAKPEIIVALGDFAALRGFLPPAAMATNLASVGLGDLVEGLGGVVEEAAEAEGDALAHSERCRAIFERLLRLGGSRRAAALRSARDHAAALAALPARWLSRLLDLYPEDPASLAPLLMRHEALAPGEALFQPPGMLHAYLEGLALEVMASSDNVLRAGLTPKQVDIEALLDNLDASPPSGRGVEIEELETGVAFRCAAEEFRLYRFGGSPEVAVRQPRGPEILVCTAGEGSLKTSDVTATLCPGRAYLVPAAAAAYRLEGNATVYVAAVPD